MDHYKFTMTMNNMVALLICPNPTVTTAAQAYILYVLHFTYFTALVALLFNKTFWRGIIAGKLMDS